MYLFRKVDSHIFRRNLIHSIFWKIITKRLLCVYFIWTFMCTYIFSHTLYYVCFDDINWHARTILLSSMKLLLINEFLWVTPVFYCTKYCIENWCWCSWKITFPNKHQLAAGIKKSLKTQVNRLDVSQSNIKLFFIYINP